MKSKPRGSGVMIERVARAFAVLAIASVATAAAGADDPLLKRLVGVWQGTGVFRWDSVAEPERLSCSITNTIAADGVFRQSGRCTRGGDSATLSMEITARAPGAYSGYATGAGARALVRQNAPFTGTGKSNKIVLIAPPGQGDAGPSITTIDLLNKGFRVRNERTDPATGRTYTAGDVTFGAI
jgi:hypothetical protein